MSILVISCCLICQTIAKRGMNLCCAAHFCLASSFVSVEVQVLTYAKPMQSTWESTTLNTVSWASTCRNSRECPDLNHKTEKPLLLYKLRAVDLRLCLVVYQDTPFTPSGPGGYCARELHDSLTLTT